MKRLSATLLMGLVALSANALPAHATEIGGEWHLIAFNTKPAAAPLSITFTTDGVVRGQAPCNRFNGTYIFDDAGKGFAGLTFSPLATTRMACDQLAAEGEYLKHLSKVDRVVSDSGHLFLITKEDMVIELARDPADTTCISCEE